MNTVASVSPQPMPRTGWLALIRAGISPRAYREISSSSFFDADWYLKTYRDVAAVGRDPVLHYLKHGASELRNPAPNFDTRWYLETYRDARDSGQNPLVHFLRRGRRDGRRPISAQSARLLAWREQVSESGFFDYDWYLETYKDVASSEFHALDHFVRFGSAELRNPGPRFNARWYVEDYPEVRASGLEPLKHYLEIGQKKGFDLVLNRYERWRGKYDVLDEKDRTNIAEDIAASKLPDVTVIVLFDGESGRFAVDTIQALSNQIFKQWKAVLIFGEDCDKAAAEEVQQAISADSRLYSVSKDNAQDAALPASDSNCFVFVSGGAMMREHALYLLARAALDPDLRLVYSDEDAMADRDLGHAPVFKPSYSPELLRHINYLGACLLVRGMSRTVTSLVDDLLQGIVTVDRLVELTLEGLDARAVRHIPAVLFHDVLAPRSTPGLLIRPEPPKGPLPTFTIIICTRDRVDLLRPCLESIGTKTDYPREKLEIVVVDNGSQDPETIRYLALVERRAKVIRDDGIFNFSRLNNLGAAAAAGEVLLLVNNDTIVNDRLWLRRIATYAMQSDVGIVGCKLLYADGTIQHDGVILGVQGVAGHDAVGLDESDPKIRFDYTREVSAVTGACLAIRRELFEQLGGLDVTAGVAFNDTLLCLAALGQGYRNIVIKEPLLIHFESRSRGFDDTPEKAALFRREARYARRHHDRLFKDDPYYSPNLCLQQPNELAFPPRRSKPWRIAARNPAKLKILILSSTHEIGHGVGVVVNQQAAYLAAAGHEIYLGGPKGKNEFKYRGCRRIYLDGAAEAASFAVEMGIDCVVAETPPFFSVVRWLGREPKTLFLDHGEPPPDLFPDSQGRRATLSEKELCFAMASKVLAISKSVRAEGTEERAGVVPNANSHLATWSEDLREPRNNMRNWHGWTDKVVILNVCRFSAGERRYKGLDMYADIMKEFWFTRPKLAKDAVFVLCGKGSEPDVDEMERAGFAVFDNVTDAEMIDLYAAADVYANFSRWEGYNLGIGQALAMGLPVIASDISAHRAFPIFTSNDTLPVIEQLSNYAAVIADAGFEPKREPIISDWKVSLAKLEREIVELCRDGDECSGPSKWMC